MGGSGKYILGEIDSMHDFHYVSKKEAAPVKADLLDLIHEVQDEVRDETLLINLHHYMVMTTVRILRES